MKTLARISHQFPTAAADRRMSTASRLKRVLNIPSGMPPRSFLRVPCIHALLHRLVTEIGEKCGLAVMVLIWAACVAACAKPMVTAKVSDRVDYLNRDYAANANDIYYAVRWALVDGGYPVANEDLQEGIITSAWLPVKSDTFYIDLFDRRDYGVTNSYYQLEVQVIPGDGRTEVRVGSRVKTMVASLKSSGVEERKILDSIGNRLRKSEPTVTNLGVEE